MDKKSSGSYKKSGDVDKDDPVMVLFLWSTHIEPFPSLLRIESLLSFVQV